MAKPEKASQIRRLAENMDLFEFAPGAHTPAEYGKYMIQESGHFSMAAAAVTILKILPGVKELARVLSRYAPL